LALRGVTFLPLLPGQEPWATNRTISSPPSPIRKASSPALQLGKRGWLARWRSGDDLTAALDPTEMKVAIKAAAAKAGASAGSPRDRGRPPRFDPAMMLVRTYRVRGHLGADLDPLGLSHRDLPADLTPEYHGFTGGRWTARSMSAARWAWNGTTVRELVQILRAITAARSAFEYMHIADVEERRFLQERIEGGDKSIDFTPEGKKAILAAVIRGEQYEKFLGKKYVGTKRFGLDGGESMIPALEAVIKYGGQRGVREIVYGMAHRGRLNVLANVMAKPYR
jgi:2-oxoglutarate dehydrogenase E1 component